jgi:hypothetical protein
VKLHDMRLDQVDALLLQVVKEHGSVGTLLELARVCEEAEPEGEWDDAMLDAMADDFRVAAAAAHGGSL